MVHAIPRGLIMSELYRTQSEPVFELLAAFSFANPTKISPSVEPVINY